MMFLASTRKRQDRLAMEAGDFLSAWVFSASADGDLLVQPLRPTLFYHELCDVVDRLLKVDSIQNSRIVFDMSNVQTIGSPWTAVFALLIRLTRFVGGCRLTSLNPTLSAMASMVVGKGQPAPAADGSVCLGTARKAA